MPKKLLIIVLIVVIGGGAILGYFWWQNRRAELPKTPEEVLKDIIEKNIREEFLPSVYQFVQPDETSTDAFVVFGYLSEVLDCYMTQWEIGENYFTALVGYNKTEPKNLIGYGVFVDIKEPKLKGKGLAQKFLAKIPAGEWEHGESKNEEGYGTEVSSVVPELSEDEEKVYLAVISYYRSEPQIFYRLYGDKKLTPKESVELQVIQVLDDSPAAQAGIKIEDKIRKLKVENLEFEINDTKKLGDLTKKYADQEVTLEIKRGDKILDISLFPQQTKTIATLEPETTVLKSYSLGIVVVESWVLVKNISFVKYIGYTPQASQFGEYIFTPESLQKADLEGFGSESNE